MSAKDDRLRERIEAKRRASVVRDLASQGDQDAIRETFAMDFGHLTRKPEHIQEVIRRVDERLGQGADNVYGTYSDVAEDFMEEISPSRKTEEEKRSDVIEEMAALRASNPELNYTETVLVGRGLRDREPGDE